MLTKVMPIPGSKNSEEQVQAIGSAPPDVQSAPIASRNDGANPSHLLKVDEAYNEDGRIIVAGWSTVKSTLQLKAGSKSLELMHLKMQRADVANHFDLPRDEKYGFVLIANTCSSNSIALSWRTAYGEEGLSQPLKFTPLPSHKTGLIGQLRNTFDQPTIGAFAIDHAIPLGRHGVLLYGWRFFVDGNVHAIRVHGANGIYCDITNNLFPVSRNDVSRALSNRFSGLTDMCGFICHVPIATELGDCRLVEVEGVMGQSEWVKIPVPTDQLSGVPLIKDLLARIPAPERIQTQLFELFDRHVGGAIESIANGRPRLSRRIVEQQFGTAPKKPTVSVIVPLYGRYDFLRYQLSHFADDRDFETIDLVYVIDDPSIVLPTQDLASSYYPVFNVPFRTISYGCNLGFGGANNVGVESARAESIVLMNSDVLPRSTGWVSKLHQALNSLPNAGAIGPLLQFSDDSIQHAGMVPKYDRRLPGFLLNIHPGKGQVWRAGNTPKKCAMLTAACLMMRKQDYCEIGGFDEGYVIGDFEDSDICLALRKRGKDLWLLPEVQLWHLERQSQNLDHIAGYRQLLTLYNGWRFQKKIHKGLIADPTQYLESGV
jgi:GT2 family glycosyltransferase